MPESGVLRWSAAGAYFIVAILCVWASFGAGRGQQRLWQAMAVALALFGLAKGLNLEEGLLDALRSAAKEERWYDWHKAVQLVTLLCIGAAALASGVLLGTSTTASSSARSAGAAMIVLSAFIAVRLISIHSVDQWVTERFAGMRLGWWVELAALIVIAAAATAFRLRSGVDQS